MNWISNLSRPGHLNEAVNHLNTAVAFRAERRKNVDISSLLNDALNKVQTEWLRSQPDLQNHEIHAFDSLIRECLPERSSHFLLDSDDIKKLVHLTPMILNHKVLRESNYDPEVELAPDVIKKASKDHKKLFNSYKRYLTDNNPEAIQSTLKRLADLLYIVRSNIAHGEKTAYGPDRQKMKRDDIVCACVIPVQIILMHLILGCPNKKLIVYGTLAPGGPNEHILKGLNGSWDFCSVNGIVTAKDNLPMFNWLVREPLMKAKIFVSDELDSHWKMLDTFEGSRYQRIIVPAKINSKLVFANIYADASGD